MTISGVVVPSGAQNSRRIREIVWGAVAVGALTLLFFLLFWNRFSGLRDANGSAVAGQAILVGRLPYRDWYCPAPPLHFLKSAALAAIFGRDLIVPRAFALFERTLLALVVYLWLARLFRIPHAVLAAVLAIVISAGDIADPISSYNHDTILYAVASGLAASLFLSRHEAQRSWTYALASGLLAGLCFSTKQTIGLGVTLGVPVAVAASISRTSGATKTMRLAAWFGSGWLIPNIAVWTWLASQGALSQYVSQVFLCGPAVKGSASAFLFRAAIVNWFSWDLRIAAAIALAAVVLTLPVLAKVDLAQSACRPARQTLLAVFGLAVVAIFAGAVASMHGARQADWLTKATINYTLLMTGILASYYAVAALRRKLASWESQFFLMSTVSFAVAFMLFLSWPAFEAMTIPGLAVLAATLFERSSGARRVALFGASGVLLFAQTLGKLNVPFNFAGWPDPPVRTASAVSTLPEMRGFILPETKVRMIDEITQIIRQHSSAGDSIFTYPPFPAFYGLTGRWWPTWASNHNLDVAPDGIARADAKTLLQTRPAVIVYYTTPELYRLAEEIMWRGGNRSGQRDIEHAIETLAKEYRLAANYDVPGTGGRQLRVYVRP